MPELKWTDADEIGYRLSRKFPALDPLTVRFADLHRWVTELDDFTDDSLASDESILEAILMAWVGCYRENKSREN